MTLHQTFIEAITDQAQQLLLELIEKKLAEQGVRVSSRQRRLIAARIAAGELENVNLSGWKWWQRRHVVISFSDDEVRDFEKSLKRLTELIPDLLTSEGGALAETVLESLRKRWPAQTKREDRDRQGFQQRLYERWQEPIESLSMMLTIAREGSEAAGTRLQDQADAHGRHLVAVLVRLHSRACQVTDEVITLIRSGFAEGAIARWRTLHEIAIVATLIQERGDAMAEKYLLHDAIESWKAAQGYQKHAERLGESPLSDAEMQNLHADRDAVLKRFGKSFGSAYGWAADNDTEDVNTFAAVEEKVTMEHWRPYYKLASHSVHANPKGVLFRLGLIRERDILLTGPSNYGFADPGQNTALSLLNLTCALLSVAPTLDDLVVMKILAQLGNEVGHAFVATQRDVERADASLGR